MRIRFAVVLVGLAVLVGCGGGTSASIERWAESLQQGDLETAEALMRNASHFDWYESIRRQLKEGTLQDYRVLAIPGDEQTAFTKDAQRVQWRYTWARNQEQDYLCADVRMNDGQIEILDPYRLAICTESGSYDVIK